MTPGGPSAAARLRESVRERLWFWPAVTAVLAAAAAEVLVRLDRSLDEQNARPLWVFSGTADAARAVLSTIASATMTVLGVTLTITLAVLALTAQGYSPRVLRRFMRDRVITAVIAGFTGSFVFALVALRLVREEEVPGVTVNVAALLAFASVFLLVWFFHHLASEIRVERLIESVWGETREAIDAYLPEGRGEGVPPTGAPGTPVGAARSGRLRRVDGGTLVEVAEACGVDVVVVARPGDYVNAGAPVAEVRGGPALDDEARTRIAAALDVGPERALGEDVRFGFRQLSDIALRALSPGVNDSTTAWEAVMRSADLLRRLSGRRLGATEAGEGRVSLAGPGWDEYVELAFDQVATQAEAQADAATARVLLDAIGRVLAATDDPGRMEVLHDRARRVRDGARRAVTEPGELARVETAADAIL